MLNTLELWSSTAFWFFGEARVKGLLGAIWKGLLSSKLSAIFIIHVEWSRAVCHIGLLNTCNEFSWNVNLSGIMVCEATGWSITLYSDILCCYFLQRSQNQREKKQEAQGSNKKQRKAKGWSSSTETVLRSFWWLQLQLFLNFFLVMR